MKNFRPWTNEENRKYEESFIRIVREILKIEEEIDYQEAAHLIIPKMKEDKSIAYLLLREMYTPPR